MLPLLVAEPFLRFGNFNRGTIQRIKEKEVQVNKRNAEHETDKNQECTTLFISLLHSTLAGHTVHVHVSPISGPFDFPCSNTFYFIPQQIGRYNTIWSSRPTIFVVPDYCLLLLPVAEPPNDWFSIERPAIKGSIWIDRTLPPPPKNKKVSTKKLKSYCCGIIAFSMRWRLLKLVWNSWQRVDYVLCAGSFEPLELTRSFKSWTILMVRRNRKKNQNLYRKYSRRLIEDRSIDP